jgi:hypothetical protein
VTKSAGSGEPVYAVQQARKVGIQADIAALALDRQRGLLISAQEVNAAMNRSAEVIVRAIEQLPSGAEDLAVAVGRDGVAGARTFLRTEARRIRDRVAQALRNPRCGRDGERGQHGRRQMKGGVLHYLTTVRR